MAESLGGKLICPNTNDPQERRIHNIVEEMAIASGTPVPPIYLMEEKESMPLRQVTLQTTQWLALRVVVLKN